MSRLDKDGLKFSEGLDFDLGGGCQKKVLHWQLGWTTSELVHKKIQDEDCQKEVVSWNTYNK